MDFAIPTLSQLRSLDEQTLKTLAPVALNEIDSASSSGEFPVHAAQILILSMAQPMRAIVEAFPSLVSNLEAKVQSPDERTALAAQVGSMRKNIVGPFTTLVQVADDLAESIEDKPERVPQLMADISAIEHSIGFAMATAAIYFDDVNSLPIFREMLCPGLQASHQREFVEAIWDSDWNSPTVKNPVGLVHRVAEVKHRQNSSVVGGKVGVSERGFERISLNDLTPTGDPIISLIADERQAHWDAEITTKVDLQTACETSGLSPDAVLWALGRYLGVPKSKADEILGITPSRVEASRIEYQRASPQVRALLADYLRKQFEINQK
jgi:hypothetical protein